jgi:hypothetical protein
VQQLQVGVEASAAVLEGPAGEPVVVRTAADAEAQGEAAVGDLVQAGGDLGQVTAAAAVRAVSES